MTGGDVAIQLGLLGLERSARKYESTLDRLVPIAKELAQLAGASGITVSDVRIVATQRGVLTGREQGRELSCLGAVMKKAGLCATDRFRRSDVVKTHGNLGRVWRWGE